LLPKIITKQPVKQIGQSCKKTNFRKVYHCNNIQVIWKLTGSGSDLHSDSKNKLPELVCTCRPLRHTSGIAGTGLGFCRQPRPRPRTPRAPWPWSRLPGRDISPRWTSGPRGSCTGRAPCRRKRAGTRRWEGKPEKNWNCFFQCFIFGLPHLAIYFFLYFLVN